jgi:hypothetical protein
VCLNGSGDEKHKCIVRVGIVIVTYFRKFFRFFLFVVAVLCNLLVQMTDVTSIVPHAYTHTHTGVDAGVHNVFVHACTKYSVIVYINVYTYTHTYI